jgi:hypothetical protein
MKSDMLAKICAWIIVGFVLAAAQWYAPIHELGHCVADVIFYNGTPKLIAWNACQTTGNGPLMHYSGYVFDFLFCFILITFFRWIEKYGAMWFMYGSLLYDFLFSFISFDLSGMYLGGWGVAGALFIIVITPALFKDYSIYYYSKHSEKEAASAPNNP